jgi:hypothetical protein
MATTSQPPDPFAAQGGGHWTGAQWVPKNHPLAGASPDGTPAPGAGGGTPAPAPPAPGEGPTTPPGEPQRPSAMPPSPPPAATPAPQIPLGTPGATPPQGGALGPMTPPGAGTPGRVTAPGLIDASKQVPTTGDPADAAFRARLLEMLSQDPNAASVTDADVAPQANAFRAAAERSALKNRAGLMEQASAQGIADTEATRNAGRAIETQAGQAIGANDAALIGQKLQGRREQLNQAVQIANARGMQREAQDLQRQLANLDAELKTRGLDVTREGYQVQRDLASLDTNTKQYLADLDGKLRQQGYGTQERLAAMDAEVRKLGITSQENIGQLEIALRRELGIGELNLGYLQAMLNDRQIGNAQGIDVGKWQSILNKDSLMAALGGGG